MSGVLEVSFDRVTFQDLTDCRAEALCLAVTMAPSALAVVIPWPVARHGLAIRAGLLPP